MEEKTQTSPTQQTMISVGDLFSKTWEFYKTHMKPLLLIALIIMAPSLLSALIVFLGLQETVVVLLSSILGIVSLVVSIWGAIAMIIYVKDKPVNINDSLKKAWGFWLSYLWLSILVGIVTMIGLIILIIPGIILVVYYAFAMYILVAENIQGWAAAKKSMNLVKNYWWAVFGRILLVGIALYIPIMLITWVFGLISLELMSIVSMILATIIVPFGVVYSYLMYQNLKQIKKM